MPTNTHMCEIRMDEAEAGSPDTLVRVDYSGELSSPKLRADGFVEFDGFVATEGILTYNRGGKIVREYVPASTLEKSMESLKRCVVTLRHPKRDKHRELVTPEHVQKLQVGDVGTNVRMVDVRVAADFVVRSDGAIKSVMDGKTTQLSAAYFPTVDPTPGVNKYGTYDLVQTDRNYNHVALVESARGGRGLYVRTDGKMNQNLISLIAMLAITTRFDSDDDAVDAISDSVEKLIEQKDAEKARADAAEAKLAAAEAKLADNEKSEKARTDAADLERVSKIAERIGVPFKDVKLRDLKLAVARTVIPDVNADAADAYIDGIVTAAGSSDPRDAYRQAQKLAGSRADAADKPKGRRQSNYVKTLRAANAALREG
ncbi:MAG: DUF2213 domain-containing protein [Hyphomicrobium sp.]|nr:DUF2213 domain-containing protein [Hyphomicrobium sp.]